MAFTGNFTCNSFKTALLNGEVDFATDTIRIALYTNAASLNAATTAYTSVGESSGGSYVAGGLVLVPTIAQADGVSYVTFADAIWSGTITARGALIYKAGGTAICVLDFGSDKTSAVQFKVEFPVASGSSAILRIQ